VPILEERLRQRTTAEWVDALIAAGVPVGPFYTVDHVLADRQVRHRGMVASDGEHAIIGNPIKTGSPDTYAPAPRLGEHTEEILGPLRAARSASPQKA
jgi:crotonobetainyl-CoA:carnitine CoA-transferase CaiB-like acyl-CoA transferase